VTDILALVILGLATWRLSHMLSREDGPGHMFACLRGFLGVRESLQGTRSADTFLGQLIACPLCLSVWIAAFLLIAWLLVPALQVVIAVLALSGLSSALELALNR
jgi:hypothetical protein